MREQIARHVRSAVSGTPWWQKKLATPEEWWEDEEDEEVESVPEFSGYDIYQALAESKLAGDQAWFLHSQGLSWQIKVKRRGADSMSKLERLVEKLYQALDRRDWEAVLKDGARLCGMVSARDTRLLDAVCDAMAVALLILEHPVFVQVSASLVRVAMRQLEDAWEKGSEL